MSSSGCSCGSNCGCGSDCKCTNTGIVENSTTTQTLISGVAPAQSSYEMSNGSENGCKCGSSCTCDPCTCK